MAQPSIAKGKNKDGLHNDYEGFVEKFKPKKTTDDCYTPPYIYDVVADYVERTYGIDKSRFVRPFYPGGDYENYDYKPDDVVVDNPPFSIMSKILTFYQERNIPFFLFAPALTTISPPTTSSRICVGVSIEYDNKAKVSTSFITNLEDCRCRTAPDLYKAIDKATKKHKEEETRSLPKYAYPDYVITAAMMNQYSKYGVDLSISKEDSFKISALDEQKEHKKTIFGSGYLLSEKAAAEKAAAEKAAAEKAAAEKAAAVVWTLSERELELIRGLGK